MINIILVLVLVAARVGSDSVPEAILRELGHHRVFPLQRKAVLRLIPAEDRSRLKTLHFDEPAAETYFRWDGEDRRCYAEFVPSRVSGHKRIERVQLGCIGYNESEAVQTARQWVSILDNRLAREVAPRLGEKYYLVLKGKGEDGAFSIEVRIQPSDRLWAVDIVLLDGYPPSYVY